MKIIIFILQPTRKSLLPAHVVILENNQWVIWFLWTHHILARTSSGRPDPVRMEQAVSATCIMKI